MEKSDPGGNDSDNKPAKKKTKYDDTSPSQDLPIQPQITIPAILPDKNSVKSPAMPNEPETIHVTVVSHALSEFSGFGVYFIPKYEEDHFCPLSCILMNDLVIRGTVFADGIVFQSITRNILHFTNGKCPVIQGKKDSHGFLVQLFVCYAECHSRTNTYYRDIANSIIKALEQKDPHVWIEIPDNFCNTDTKVWADIMGFRQALNSLKGKLHSVDPATGLLRQTRSVYHDDLDAYYHIGTVPRDLSQSLGLPCEMEKQEKENNNNNDDGNKKPDAKMT